MCACLRVAGHAHALPAECAPCRCARCRKLGTCARPSDSTYPRHPSLRGRLGRAQGRLRAARTAYKGVQPHIVEHRACHPASAPQWACLWLQPPDFRVPSTSCHPRRRGRMAAVTKNGAVTLWGVTAPFRWSIIVEKASECAYHSSGLAGCERLSHGSPFFVCGEHITCAACVHTHNGGASRAGARRRRVASPASSAGTRCGAPEGRTEGAQARPNGRRSAGSGSVTYDDLSPQPWPY